MTERPAITRGLATREPCGHAWDMAKPRRVVVRADQADALRARIAGNDEDRKARNAETVAKHQADLKAKGWKHARFWLRPEDLARLDKLAKDYESPTDALRAALKSLAGD